MNIVNGILNTTQKDNASIYCSGGTVNIDGRNKKITISSTYHATKVEGTHAVYVNDGTVNMYGDNAMITSGTGDDSIYARGVLVMNKGKFNMESGKIYINARNSRGFGGTGFQSKEGGRTTITGGGIVIEKTGHSRCALCANDGGSISAKNLSITIKDTVDNGGGFVYWQKNSANLCYENVTVSKPSRVELINSGAESSHVKTSGCK